MKRVILVAALLLGGCDLLKEEVLYAGDAKLVYVGTVNQTCIRCSITTWAQFEFDGQKVYSLEVDMCNKFTMPVGYILPAKRVVTDHTVRYTPVLPKDIWEKFCY